MKLAIVVLSVLTIVAVSSYAEAKDDLDEIKEACMLKTGATHEEVQSLFDFEIPQTRSGKCFAACIAKESGFMSSGNKLNIEQVRKLNIEPGLLSVMKVCTYVTEEDECEAIKQAMECVKQNWKAA